jgi:hypothetical protein
MFALSARQQCLIIVILTVLMAATRIEHFGKFVPDASTAIFFIAGFLIGSPLWLFAFLAEAMALDVAAIKIVGVDSVCVTLGYCMMVPAYASLWLAPRLVRESFNFDFLCFGKLVFACVGGTAAFFLFSNIGYYIGGGFDATIGFVEYASRVARYFPYYLGVTVFYAAVVFSLVVLTRRLVASGSVVVR